MGLRKKHVATQVALAMAVAAADGAMLAMMVPVGRGIATGDFSSFWSIPLIGRILPQPGEAIATLFVMAGVMLVLALIKNGFAHVQHTVSGRLRERFAKNLAEGVFQRYLEFGKGYYDRTSIGEMTAVMEYRLDAVRLFLDFGFLCTMLALLAAYISVMLLISWRLTLAAILLFPLVQWASRRILNESAKAAETMKESGLHLGRQLHSALTTISLYQSAGRQEAALASFSETVDRFGRNSRRLWQVRGLNMRVQELTGLCALLLMLAAASVVDRQRLSQGVLLLVFFFLARISTPILATIPDTLLNASEKLPHTEALLRVFQDEGKHIVPGGARKFEGLEEGIRFERLTFTFPGGAAPALDSVSFTVPKGKMTALVGPSGAGKSTITQLLLRFYDVPSGAIWIDGVDIREFSLMSLRSGMAVAGQEATMLPGTLRENLLFGVGRKVSEAEILQAVADARLGELVDSQPKGLEMTIGERGATLSGGERQRVSITRALLRRAPLLILDEATNALDAITEKLVQEAMQEALDRTTALVVAHRFSTIQRAAHVVVLEEGRVVEQGSVEELLARSGLFASMWRQQKFA